MESVWMDLNYMKVFPAPRGGGYRQANCGMHKHEWYLQIANIYTMLIRARNMTRRCETMSSQHPPTPTSTTHHQCVSDVIYHTKDENNVSCFTRIAQDTRADFFPEDYTFDAQHTVDPFHCDYQKADTPCEFVSYAANPPQATTHLPRVVRPRVKLEQTQVCHIRMFRNNKLPKTAAKLATIFGVTPKTIREIWRGITWKKM